MSDPFKEFGGEIVEDPFKEFGGEIESAPSEKTLIGDIKSFFKDPSFEKLKTLGDDTPTASAIRGGIKSAYLGFDDSIVGALGGDKEKYKSEQERLEKINPKAFLGGEIGGGFATPTGAGALLKAPRLAKLAQSSPRLASVLAQMGMGGLQGGAAGLGYSDGEVDDGLLGAGVGAAVPGVLGAGGKLINKLPSKKTVTKALSGLDDLEYDVSATRDLSEAKTDRDMSRVYRGVDQNIKNKVTEKAEKAQSLLRGNEDLLGSGQIGEGKLPGVRTEDLKRRTMNFFEDNLMSKRQDGQFRFDSDADARLGKQIYRQLQKSLEGEGEMISEKATKKILQKVDEQVAKWDASADTKNKLLQRYYGNVNELLSQSNPEFHKAQTNLSKWLQLQGETQKGLNMRGGNLSDATKNIERKALDGEKFSSQQLLRKLKATGTDLEDEALKRMVLTSTEGGAPVNFLERMGVQKGYQAISQPVLLGAAGGAAGYSQDQSSAGVGAGILAGLVRQKYGKRLGRDFLQSQMKKNPNNVFAIAAKGTKEQQQKMAEDYLKKGNRGLAASYYVLSQRNKDLREEKE